MAVIIVGHVTKKKSSLIKDRYNLAEVSTENVNTPIVVFIKSLYN
jgi:hypothetical protein